MIGGWWWTATIKVRRFLRTHYLDIYTCKTCGCMVSGKYMELHENSHIMLDEGRRR